MADSSNKVRVYDGQIVPEHLIRDRDAYRELIQRHFSDVSPKSLNQMQKASESPSNQFWTQIIWPNLWLDSTGQSVIEVNVGVAGVEVDQRPAYFPIADTIKTSGRNHLKAVELAAMDPSNLQEQVSLFANLLRVGCHDEHGVWEAPSLRQMLGPYMVFTLEYDADVEDRELALSFLDTQLGWFRKTGSNDLDRPIRPIWDWASKFSDFRGISANWGGNKSLHIHLIFDTSRLMQRVFATPEEIRRTYGRLWLQMRDEIVRIFPQKFDPDPSMVMPEQYRKLPNGLLVVEPSKKPHLLRIPLGTPVPLLCVWEKLLTRSPKGADRAFVHEGIFKQEVAKSRPRISSFRRRSRIGDMTLEEHAYCNEQFASLMEKRAGPDGYPRAAGLFKESVWVGRLYARAGDRNPSTIIFEDGHRTYVQGGKEPEREISIGLPLRVFLGNWRRDYRRKCGLALPSLPVEEIDTRRPEEMAFEEVFSQNEARCRLGELVPGILAESQIVLLRAPEGLGKTTTVAAHLPALSHNLFASSVREKPENTLLRDVEWRRPSAFAFSSYELAHEKAREFNASVSGKKMRAVVMPSFTRIYEDAREALDAGESISSTAAAEAGFESVAAAIRELQPTVWSEMERRHADCFQRPGGVFAVPDRYVYFVVHQVLQQLTTNILAAAFLHPRFFNTEDWWRLGEEMKLRVAVHDEVPREALVHMHRADQVEWCLDLFERTSDVWNVRDVGLVEKLKTYEAKREGGKPPVTFGEVLEIHRVGYQPSDQTEVAECERYGGGRLYAETCGRRWYVRKRNWWSGLAQRTVLLTTESLPTQMARDISGFEVFDLRTPQLRVGSIQLHLRQSCSSDDAAKITEELRVEVGDPTLHVVSNRAKNIEFTSTHAGVRGSNEYAGINLGQTAFYLAPEEHERLQIVNRIFGLNAAIGLRHTDEINQTAGRNLGFRHRGGVQHHLVMGWSLHEEIEHVLASECRYDLTLIEDADQRRKVKFADARGSERELREQQEELEVIADMEKQD